MKEIIFTCLIALFVLEGCVPSVEYREEPSPRKITIEFIDGKILQDVFIVSSDKDFLYMQELPKKVEKFHIKKIVDQYGRDMTQQYLSPDTEYLKAKALDSIAMTLNKTSVVVGGAATVGIILLILNFFQDL